jgi:thiamine pyrophosphokinase
MTKNRKPTRAVLVGPCLKVGARVPSADFLIGVDGGIKFLKGKHPDLVIGDWDSAKQTAAMQFEKRGSRLVTLSKRKNQSDLAAALAELAKHPQTDLALYGFTGGRADHHLSNLLEIAHFAATHSSKIRFQKVAAFGADAEYHFLTHSQPVFRRAITPGAEVSVFALLGTAKGVSMKGFEYNLTKTDLEPGSRGLSNIVRSRQVEISLTHGVLVVVVPRG